MSVILGGRPIEVILDFNTIFLYHPWFDTISLGEAREMVEALSEVLYNCK